MLGSTTGGGDFDLFFIIKYITTPITPTIIILVIIVSKFITAYKYNQCDFKK